MADDASAHPDVLNQAAQGQLKSIIERIERLELDKTKFARQTCELFVKWYADNHVADIMTDRSKDGAGSGM